MLKYYVNEKSEAFVVKKEGYIALPLENAKKFYQNLINAPLGTAIINGNTIITRYGTDIEVVFSLAAFGNEYNVHNSYLEILKNLINNYLESANIKNLRKIKPFGLPKINRAQSKMVGTLVASTLAATLLFNLYLTSDKKSLEDAKVDTKNFKWEPKLETIATAPESSTILDSAEFLNSQESIDSSKISEMTVEDKNDTLDESSNTIICNFPFEVKDDGKFETTVENCAPYAEEYIARYGLPRDLTYALLTQESGSLTDIDDRIGAPNPGRIDPKQMNGEFFKVEVYKDGVFTGEYDTFYAVATEADKSNPKYAGYKVLAIDNLKEHFQIICGYFSKCIYRYKSASIALDAYNKGLYAFSNVYDKNLVVTPHSREYYQEHFDDFSWTNLIAEHYKKVNNDPNFVYGDPNYLNNVLRYLPLTDGKAMISYKWRGEDITVELYNQNLLDKSEVVNYNNITR